MGEAEHHHVVPEGLALVVTLPGLPSRDMEVVRPEDHPSVRPDAVAEPDRVLRHGLIARLRPGHAQVVLEGDPQGAQGDGEGLLAPGEFVLRLLLDQVLARRLHRGAALRPIVVRLVAVAGTRTPTAVVVGEATEAIESLRHQSLALRVHRPDVLADEVQRHSRRLHVHAVEPEVPAGLVVGAHPLDHLEHRLRVPGPEVEPGEQLPGVAFSGAHIAVEPPRLRPGRFDGEGVEVHLLDQEPEDAGLHLEEVPRAVRVLPERHDPGVSHDLAQELELPVRKGEMRAGKRMDIRVQPSLHLFGNRYRRRRRDVLGRRGQRGGRRRRVAAATRTESHRSGQRHNGADLRYGNPHSSCHSFDSCPERLHRERRPVPNGAYQRAAAGSR